MSAPQAPKAPLRTRSFLVRMTPDEHADALACAKATGVSLSRLMRSRAETLPPPRADLVVASELTRIGSNLNQMVRADHSGFGVRADELEALLLDVRDQVASLRGQLRRRS